MILRAFILLLVLCQMANAQLYITSSPIPAGTPAFYVDNSIGLDTYDGSSATVTGGHGPFQHGYYALTNSAVAAAAAVGNVSVLFNGAEVFQEPPIIDRVGGTAAYPLLISSYGVGQATLTNTPTIPNTPNILQLAASYVVVSNIACLGNTNGITNTLCTSTTPTSCGIVIFTSSSIQYSNITIANCTVGGCAAGIFPYATNDGYGVRNLTINNCVITNCGLWGMLVWGQDTVHAWDYVNLVISNNTVSNIYGQAGLNDCGGIAFGNSTNVLVMDNHTSYCGTNSGGSTTLGGPFGIAAVYSSGVIDSYNETDHITWNANGKVDGVGNDFDLLVDNSIMEYNYSHHNYTAGLYLFGCTYSNVVRFNISEANGQTGASGFEGAELVINSSTITNLLIYGNTLLASFYTNSAINGPTNIYGSNGIWNNLLFSASSNSLCWPAGGANTSFNGNDYWTTASSGPQFKIGSTIYTGLSAFTTAGYDNTGFSKSIDPNFLLGWQYVWYNSISGNGAPNQLTNWETSSASSPVTGKAVDLNYTYGVNNGGFDYRGNVIGNTNYAIGAVTQTGTPGYTNIFAGLINWYPFFGSALSTVDFAGNLQNYAIVGSPTYGSNYITWLASSSQHATIPAYAAAATTPLTLTAWVRITNTASSQYILGGQSGAPAFGINLTTNNLFLFKDNTSVIAYSATAGTVPSGVSTWTHVVCTYDGTTATFYTNGVSAGSLGTTATAFTTSASRSIGYERQLGANYFNGDMRGLNIFNRILSTGEITDLYNLGLLANMNGIVGQ